MFDFVVDEHGWIVKDGHYSQAEARESTREERLLWDKVRELEALLEAARPNEVKVLLEKMSGRREVAISNRDFTLLRVHAKDKVEIETHAPAMKKGLFASMPWMDDGSPTRTLIYVKRDLEDGEVADVTSP